MRGKSKLTDSQWQEIERLLQDGVSGCSAAKKYGITYNAIKKRLGAHVHQIKSVSKQIVETDVAMKSISIGAQIQAVNQVVNLTEKLRSVSEHLLCAAEHGAMTSHRLSLLARNEVQKIDDVDPLKSIKAVRGAALMTELANKAAYIGLTLLNANAKNNQEQSERILRIVNAPDE